MNPNLISLAITIIFFVFVAFGFLFGYLKGAMKSFVDVVAALSCVILSVPITKLLVNIFLSPVTIKIILGRVAMMLPPDAVETIRQAQDLLTNEGTKEATSDMVRLVAAMPVIIITPIIFMLVFAALALYLYIVALFVKIFACKKTEKTKMQRYKLLGGGLGAIAVGTVLTMFLTPIWGYSDLVTNVVEHFEESSLEVAEEPEVEETLDTIKSYTKTVNGNVFPAVSYNLGGRLMFKSLTTIKVDKTKINLQNEVMSLVELAGAANDLSNDELEEYGPKQVAAINKMNETLEKSEYLPLVASSTISFVSTEYSKGHKVFGVAKPDFGESFNPTFDRIINVTKDTSPDDVRKDVRMVSNILIHAIENEIFAEEFDIWAIFENPEFLGETFIEIYKNDRTSNAIPYIADFITNYTYEIYNDINETNKEPEEFDYSHYNEDELREEAESISNMAKDLHAFFTSAEFEEETEYKTVINEANFAALGRALQFMRDGMLTNRMFDIMFYAFLRSEAASNTGLVDDVLMEKALQDDANLELLFSSRQNVLKLALAIQENKPAEERKELIHSVVEDILLRDESTSAFISRDNLITIGMSEKEADSIDAIVNSMVDGAHECEFESEEEKAIEVEKTEVIIDAVSNTVLVESDNTMFKVGDDDESTTNMSAKEFVDSVLDSRLSMAMINNAVVNEDGEVIEDPYMIHSALSDSDRNEITNALNESYAKEDLTEEERQALDSLSIIFCTGTK